MAFFTKVVVGVLILTAVFILFLHKEISSTAEYVTSDKCQECHQDQYHNWQNNTLHPHMFRPVKSDADILGDFTIKDPAVTFKKDDIEYVVGNRWEQVYVKMIEGEYYPLTAKWYVIQKRWVPYKVNDWHETKMSYQCNGCHTTGFDPNTLEFSEFGIGCEACHGPGSKHVQNRQIEHKPVCKACHDYSQKMVVTENDIIRSVSPSVCGQCHNRGKNKTGDVERKEKFNFPINFMPNENINDALNPVTVQSDKKGKYWWGAGISNNRHQEFSDWNLSKHSKAHTLLVEKYKKDGDRGKLTDECLRCHSTEYLLSSDDSKPTLDSVRFGVTCVACHEPHGRDKHDPGFGDGQSICATCHINDMEKRSSKTGKSHTPCPSTAVSCADCHMPYVVKTGGFFSLRSHAFRIISPMESEQSKMPNSCQNGGCHDDQSLEWAIEQFKSFYPDFIPVQKAVN